MQRKMKLFILLFGFLTACSQDRTVDWYESFRFTGTVEDKMTEERLLVMKEYKEPDGRRKGNIYKIPVENINEYEAGDKLQIIVEKNTSSDEWDLDHMRFEIEHVKN
ncbi:hypothetical protein [Halobacillus sp. A5]|uniref:hypothetical protein n=1 Tax=Halobacillus sp. A5 TaxID=2880263 RepID=UPI0020A6D2DA|nr:hypothetical protein [Halobacillus sp. A5]MCP3028522.1 hypothetical protein [Halobacillus sp. A5]